MILRSAALNGLDNVKGHPLALGNGDSPQHLQIDPHTRGAFTVPSLESKSVGVTSATLDAFAHDQGLDEIDLVKLDAAGNEAAVLRGAGQLLDRRAIAAIVCKLYHPTVVAERFPGAEGPQEAVDFLRSRGYAVVVPDGVGGSCRSIEELFAHGEYSVPALATPDRLL